MGNFLCRATTVESVKALIIVFTYIISPKHGFLPNIIYKYNYTNENVTDALQPFRTKSERLISVLKMFIKSMTRKKKKKITQTI